MDIPSLPKLLEEINKWTTATGFPRGIEIPWSLSQLEVAVNYFSKFEAAAESEFSSRMHNKFFLHREWPNRFQLQNYKRFAKLVVNFFEELGQLFKVPELSHMDQPPKKNELVAGFIGFLLQLLHPDPHYNASSRYPFVEDLRFLATILDDAPFQDNLHHQVQQTLLNKFQKVANNAGALVHSLVFSPKSLLHKMDTSLTALSHNIQHLKESIERSLDSLPDYLETEGIVESPFIVHSLLRDLEDLMNQDSDVIRNVMYHFQRIHRIISLCVSSPNHGPKLQIRFAREVNYLINSYVVGNVHLWYISRRFTQLIQNFEKVEECEDTQALNEMQAKPSTLQSFQIGGDPRVDEQVLFGIEETGNLILDQLTGLSKPLRMIAIVGMPGLGKTTLARKLYNHDFVNYRFDKRSWCVISQKYHRKSVLSTILMDLSSDLTKATILKMTEEAISLQISKSLKGRRYFIVVDDLWNPEVCYDLRRIFPNDKTGSRILFTSRSKDVASIIGSTIHELPFLSDEKSWMLLQKKVFADQPCPQELEEIGQQIARICKGLPLAVVVIAGLLSTRLDANRRSEWEKIGESVKSLMLADQSNSIMQILELSYIYLPPQLKPCFLYFGLFQEDTEISVKELIHRWIAEGFIHAEENVRVESVAEQYLMDLTNKSLVIVAKRRSDGGAKACAVHDLLHEMCLKIGERENFLKVAKHDSLIWNQKFQHMRVHIDPLNQPASGYLVPYSSCMRTICGSLPDISIILDNVKLLRVLCCTTRFNGLFGVESLVLLRYLVLDHMVPSIDCLENLEFLIVNSESTPITSNILKMAKLKYLRFQKTFFARDCCVSQPNNLEYLSMVAIRNPGDEVLLRYSPHLRTLKCEYQPSWIRSEEYPCLDLHFLSQLESLTITAELLNRSISDIIFPRSIRKLSLSGFCLPWQKMSMIGRLPCLEVLKLRFYAFEGDIWETCEDEFMHLKFLKLNRLDLSAWVVSDHQDFPKLQRLVIEDCMNLEQIPPEIGKIATLLSIEVHGMCSRSLVESAREINEVQPDHGNDDFRLVLRDIENGSDSDE